jgi:hypothetical protein
MQATPFNAMRKREELKAQRNLLFKRFLRNPLDTSFALKIKSIDDQIAASDEQMERERDVELNSTRFPAKPVAHRHHGPNSKKFESGR